MYSVGETAAVRAHAEPHGLIFRGAGVTGTNLKLGAHVWREAPGKIFCRASWLYKYN